MSSYKSQSTCTKLRIGLQSARLQPGLQAAAPYIVAVIATVIAGGVRLALDPLLGGNYPYIVFILPVLATIRYGGWKPRRSSPPRARSRFLTNAFLRQPAVVLFLSPQWSLHACRLHRNFLFRQQHLLGNHRLLEVCAWQLQFRAESYARRLEREVASHVITQQNLRNANESLESRVSERTAELVQARTAGGDGNPCQE